MDSTLRILSGPGKPIAVPLVFQIFHGLLETASNTTSQFSAIDRVYFGHVGRIGRAVEPLCMFASTTI
jgi:hypothetical protein